VVQASAAVATVGANRRAEPQALLIETDLDKARAFGGRVGDTGLARAGPTPTGTDVLVSHHLASRLRVQAGRSLEVFAYGATQTVHVRGVLSGVGLAGLDIDNLYVAPGTI